ncbi:MAG: signal peptidase I [Bacillota bacterium]|nr:signal peptidase I [Bacillota bacterium]
MSRVKKGRADRNKKRFRKEATEYVILMVATLVFALILKTFVFARADVEGQSMLSTLNDKDVLFVEKLSILTRSFSRGEIVIFDSKDEERQLYVKRVIGIAGDTIEIKNGKVYLNDKLLKEDYLNPNTLTNAGTFLPENVRYSVPNGYVFVLGDNREHSLDSRFLGPINTKDIKGHTIVRIYPFNKVRIF